MYLLGCPRCSRHYDVSNLAPETQVRCVCDEVLEVGFRKELPVGGLKCANCGASAGPEEASCAHCGGDLCPEDRAATTLCPECFTRLADDSTHCRKCGLELHAQAVSPLPEDGACPRCAGGLRLRFTVDADVIECADCGGMWVAPAVFDRLCRKAVAQPESQLFKPVEQPAVVAGQLGYIPCVSCGELMNRRQFRQGERSSGVVIDVCRDHGAWLDHAELEKILSFVRREAGGSSGEYTAVSDGTTGAPLRIDTAPSSDADRWRGEGLIDTALEILGSLFTS